MFGEGAVRLNDSSGAAYLWVSRLERQHAPVVWGGRQTVLRSQAESRPGPGAGEVLSVVSCLVQM